MPSDVTFKSLVISLASSAAVHFGDLGDPVTGEKQPRNLPAAAQAIELLSILEQKTKNNLDPDEQDMLSQVLVELRLRFVQLAGGDKTST